MGKASPGHTLRVKTLARSPSLLYIQPKPTVVAAPAPAQTAATAASTADATAATATTAAASPAAPPAAPASVDPDQVEGLISMGFAEAHVRAALEATGGNPDAAYTLLESGGPIQPPAPPATAGSAAPTVSGAPGAIMSLEDLRASPQFDQLRRMVQSNPNAIDQVLAVIGQQSPQLFQVILAQQDAFIAMMNEPIEGTEAVGAGAGAGAAGAGAGGATQAQVNPFAGLGAMGMRGMEGMGGENGPSPQQLAQMLQSMPEAQRNQLLSTLVGLPLEQVEQFSGQLIQALASGTAPGMPGAGGGAMPPGAQRIELTAEEAANLNQLVEMGFERNEALQVFLACDKNLEMAASVLFQEAEAGGGSGGPGRGEGGESEGGDSAGSGGDRQMY